MKKNRHVLLLSRGDVMVSPQAKFDIECKFKRGVVVMVVVIMVVWCMSERESVFVCLSVYRLKSQSREFWRVQVDSLKICDKDTEFKLTSQDCLDIIIYAHQS